MGILVISSVKHRRNPHLVGEMKIKIHWDVRQQGPQQMVPGVRLGEETGYDRTEKLSVRLDDFRKIRGNERQRGEQL